MTFREDLRRERAAISYLARTEAQARAMLVARIPVLKARARKSRAIRRSARIIYVQAAG